MMKLKPCPICGDDVELKTTGEWGSEIFEYHLSNNDCFLDWMKLGYTTFPGEITDEEYRKAAEKWNKRVRE